MAVRGLTLQDVQQHRDAKGTDETGKRDASADHVTLHGGKTRNIEVKVIKTSVDVFASLVNQIKTSVDLVKSSVDVFESLVNLVEMSVDLVKTSVDLVESQGNAVDISRTRYITPTTGG